MKKIAIITPGALPVPPIKGGAVENLVNSFCKCNALSKRYDVTVFSVTDKKFDTTSWDNPYTHYELIQNNWFCSFVDWLIYHFALIFLKNKNTTSFKNLMNRYRYFLKLRKYLKNNNYDLVILENHFAEFISLKPKKLQEKYYNKVVFHSHNIPAHYKCFIKYANILRSFYSVSNALNEKWIEVFKNQNVKKDIIFGTIKNGINTDIFNSSSVEKSQLFFDKYRIPKDKKIILYPGRLTRQKGVFKLIEAFKKLDDSYYLLLAGDFFFGSKVKNKDTSLISEEIDSLEERVTMTGFIPYEDMPKVYSVADVIVMPSLEFDSAPLSLIESICSCKPIITTNVGGIKQYSQDAGVIVLEIDGSLVDNLVSNIKKICDDHPFRNELIKKSRGVYETYSELNYFESFSACIEKALK